MTNDDRPARNPFVILREEFDDWAILFDPDSGNGFGLNPMGVYVWKLLDGEHTMRQILHGLRAVCGIIPEEAANQIKAFLDTLTANGLAGLSQEGSRFENQDQKEPWCEDHRNPSPMLISEARLLAYEPPKLVDFGGREAAYGDCVSGSSDSMGCQSGVGAGGNCFTGTSPTYQCGNGAVASQKCCTGGSPGWANNCWAGDCPYRYSASCGPGGRMCTFGTGAGDTLCSTGGSGSC